ncbi:MAG: translation elongation factor Ts [Treponema sp.]|nr:translation elongation factor Ts [Treponema sp.]
MADMSMVKKLRETTGAGMMDCKKALDDTNGDFEAAMKLLKEKGLAAVAKRSERATAEGHIFVRQVGNKIAIAELCCETDFVSNNEDFKKAGEKILDLIFEKGYTKVEQELSDVLLDFATRTRENMSVSKVQIIEVPANAARGIYVHSDFKSAAIVIINGSADPKAEALATDCCMAQVAYKPAYVKKEDVPQSYIDEQKEIFIAQMNADEKMASKPEAAKAKILEGKINKTLGEVSLLDQSSVEDDKMTIAQRLDAVGKELGTKLELASVNMFLLGQ